MIALVFWFYSSLGLLGSLGLALSAVVPPLEMPLALALKQLSLYTGLSILYVWVALAVMTWGWVRNRPVRWHWPLLGTALGLFYVVYYAFHYPVSLLFVAPCVLLSLRLAHFHATAGTLGAQHPHES